MRKDCSTCVLRYHCDEITEWKCTQGNNSHYVQDTTKILELEEKTNEEWRPV